MWFIPKLIAFIAELAIANAFHMRTSYFFLDRIFAFRTLPCIIMDPGWVGFLRIDELEPLGHILALYWIMRLFSTFIAIHFATRTYNCVYLHHIRLYTEIGTLFVWTIANVFVLNSVIDAYLLSIKLSQLRGNSIHKSL